MASSLAWSSSFCLRSWMSCSEVDQELLPPPSEPLPPPLPSSCCNALMIDEMSLVLRAIV
jgi:hypothetical protein